MTRSSINRFFGWYNLDELASFYVRLISVVAAGNEFVENMFFMAMFFLCKFLVFLMFVIAIKNTFLTD